MTDKEKKKGAFVTLRTENKDLENKFLSIYPVPEVSSDIMWIPSYHRDFNDFSEPYVIFVPYKGLSILEGEKTEVVELLLKNPNIKYLPATPGTENILAKVECTDTQASKVFYQASFFEIEV